MEPQSEAAVDRLQKGAIDRMKSVEWFASVGRQSSLDLEMNLVWLDSWQQAIDLRGAPRTSDAFTEGSNRLTRELSDRFRGDYRKWNYIARAARQLLAEEIEPQIDLAMGRMEATVANAQIEFIRDSIRWDLSHFAMEQAYSHLVQPGFYTALFAIYQAGHFPCNWDERWPNGRLWIY